MKQFDIRNDQLTNQYAPVEWIAESGLDETALREAYDELMKNEAGLSRAMLKAKTYELIANRSRIAVDKADIFQEKLFSGGLIARQRGAWEKEVTDRIMPIEKAEKKAAWEKYGSYSADGDYGHTSPNSKLLLEIGVTGLLARVKEAAARSGLTEKQFDFYRACEVTLTAFLRYLERLADAISPYDTDGERVLRHLTEAAPADTYEAMQLLISYFFFHEYVGGTRVRTLGRLDVLLEPFYQRDLAEGRYTDGEIREMMRFFLHKFFVAKVPFGLPFCLGGLDADEREVTCQMSYLIVEVYRELKITSPKIHIRVSDKTPTDFIKLVLDCIRDGVSSFVFVNDATSIKSLEAVGIDHRDALDYVPIGCYEPAVWGVEIGCTGNGGVNLAKAVELVVTGGIDLRTGERCGLPTGRIESYEAFVSAIKAQLSHLTDRAISYICTLERHYGEISPDPLLSAMYDASVASGVDVYEGGAKYNNSSLYYWCIASLVDSVAAVKKLVFEDGDVTFEQLCEILKNNWQGHEALRRKALRGCEKYGNNTPLANRIAQEFSDFVAEISLGRPNGRGGVFKPALFSIDHYVDLGKKTMATPDGRPAGDILSKNLCATVGMDKGGITSLIHAVTEMPLWKFPTGSVLDVVLHPSAVEGNEGLDAFLGILTTYFKKGGSSMHGNVFRADQLRAAQLHPEAYKNLQVRVCGWNVYFVNLRKEEQDAFIRQTEALLGS